MCDYTKASEFCRAICLVEHNTKEGMKMFKSLLQHCINNTLYQSKLPLSDTLHCANKMCSPKWLHTLFAELTFYMLESLQGLMSGERRRDFLGKQHIRMFNSI